MPFNGIMLLGEAWNADEEYAGAPFVGYLGQILDGMLRQVGIRRNDCYITNVFNLKPPGSNDLANLCGPKAEAIPGFTYLRKSKYVLAKYASELERLYKEIEEVQPNVIVAMGPAAAWALLNSTGIRPIRGAATWSDRVNRKVLPTYNPSMIQRDWSLRPIVLSDLFKAKREAEFPELRRPQRYIWLEPSVEDLYRFRRDHIDPSDSLSVDIESIRRMVTCIGFAPSIEHALVVPFYDPNQPDGNYWRTFEEEKAAWNFVRDCCRLPKSCIVGQNFQYDMNFLWTEMGITVPYVSDDTMLLHHALQPEMEKGLAFLGSVYTNEAAWKFERKDNKTLKKED